jgi:hypothetical protein
MSAVLERIAAVVGAPGLITDETGMAPYTIDWRRRYTGRPLAVVRPASTHEVAEVIKVCAGTRTAVVPQGGNTGLQGGSITDSSGTQIVLCTARMGRVRAIDPINNTITSRQVRARRRSAPPRAPIVCSLSPAKAVPPSAAAFPPTQGYRCCAAIRHWRWA